MPKFSLKWLTLLVLSAPLAAQQPGDASLTSIEMQGTVGESLVGLNYTVRNSTNLVTAHYFYAAQLKNITLSGSIQGETVQLKGEDGSVFTLHFVGNGSNGKDPLTFSNCLGMTGGWKLGSRTLPVKLTGLYGTPNPGERLYEEVTPKSDAEFESMVQAAKKAFLKGNPDKAVKFVHFPLTVNNNHKRTIYQNPAQLKTNWSQVFSPILMTRLKEEVPHEMFVHGSQAMLGHGEMWFDARGLEVVNVEPQPIAEPDKGTDQAEGSKSTSALR